MAQERQPLNCKLRPETVKRITELEKAYSSRADFFDALLAAFTGDTSPQDTRITELEKEIKEKTHEAGSLGIDIRTHLERITELESQLKEAQENQAPAPLPENCIELTEKEATLLQRLAGEADIKEWLIYKLICQIFKFYPRPVEIASPPENYQAYKDFMAP
jgi:hypothetical protein